MVSNQLNRFAFTMIELIFAIVIIAITVLSLPMMTQVTSKGIENSIVQEAIFAASAELMGASAGYWDVNSMYDNNVSHISRVIDIGSTCNNDTSSPRYGLRPGHIAQPFHRRCISNASIGASNEANTIYPNLNNAVHGSQTIFTDTVTNSTGYKEDYNSSVTIITNANIKNIEVQVTDSDGNLLTVLKMQSANIGEIDYFKRRF